MGRQWADPNPIVAGLFYCKNAYLATDQQPNHKRNSLLFSAKGYQGTFPVSHASTRVQPNAPARMRKARPRSTQCHSRSWVLLALGLQLPLHVMQSQRFPESAQRLRHVGTKRQVCLISSVRGAYMELRCPVYQDVRADGVLVTGARGCLRRERAPHGAGCNVPKYIESEGIRRKCVAAAV